MNTIFLGLILIFQVACLAFGSWLILHLDAKASHRSHFDAGCLLVLAGFGCLDILSGHFEFLLLAGEILVLVSILFSATHPVNHTNTKIV